MSKLSAKNLFEAAGVVGDTHELAVSLLRAIDVVSEDIGAQSVKQVSVYRLDSDDLLYTLSLNIDGRMKDVAFFIIDRRAGECSWHVGKQVVINALIDEFGPHWEDHVPYPMISDVLFHISPPAVSRSRRVGSVKMNELEQVYWWYPYATDFDRPAAWAIWKGEWNGEQIAFWNSKERVVNYLAADPVRFLEE